MSQSGKILHLYVEVRSVQEREGLQGPDVPQTPLTPQLPAHGSIGLPDKSGGSSQSISSTKSISRPSVSFQLHPSNNAGQSPVNHRQSLPYNNFGPLLSATRTPGTLVQTQSTEHEPFYRRHHQVSGRHTAPPTPSGGCRARGVTVQDEEGQRSVVTYSYIEKASIKSASNSLCHIEPKNPFIQTMDEQRMESHIRKRLSDPSGFKSWESMGNSSPRLPCSQRFSTNLRRATLDSIAREATHRALEDFGSPQLRQRFQHQDHPRCRSWSGSPVLPRGTYSLPNSSPLLGRHRSVYGLPRSPATDQLSSNVRQSYYSRSTCGSRSHGALQQQHSEESPRLPHRYGPPLPSCRPTAIQHEIPAMTITHAPCIREKGSHSPTDSLCSSLQIKFNHTSPPDKQKEESNELSGKKSLSPSTTSPEMARKLAEEATKLSTLFMERRSPSPTMSSPDTNRSDSPKSGHLSRESLGTPVQSQCGSHSTQVGQENAGHCSPFLAQRGCTSPAVPARLHRMDTTASPVRDPRVEKEGFLAKDSPIPHRHQPPQYTAHSWSPSMEHKPHISSYNREQKGSPENTRRPYMEHVNDTVVNWPSRLHKRPEKPTADRCDTSNENQFVARSPLASQKDDLHGDGSADPSVEQRPVSYPEGESDSTPGLSKSSSGVTGSLGDGSQPERDSESSGPTSQRSSNTKHITLGMQKTARAKWEFLFGAPSEDQHGNKGNTDSSTLPPSGTSSESPTPHSVLPLKPMAHRGRKGQESQDEAQPMSCHDVQHIEVELVTPPQSAPTGCSPRMGIIRRTIKYSETDLDAVPLRCYRETDIDEVLLAEQEEVDSAFGSNRSVLGTSGTSSSPPQEALDVQTDGEEEDLEEEGVVSWASVRMEGDKKRQNDTQGLEVDGIFSRLLKGPIDTPADSHSTLKSPITVPDPRRTSGGSLDSFSRHFESIMESHRAKGTSYSSLDSVDLMTNVSPVFTFDLPTLTPEIQSQICDSARQIIELTFAPLARTEPPSLSEYASSDATLAHSGEDQGNDVTQACDKPQSDAISDIPSLPREVHGHQVSVSNHEVAECLALGSTDHLANSNKADLQAARRLAKRLYHLEGFRKSDVARHLSKNNAFSQMVAEEYLCFFNFSGLTVDQALRAFLKEFALMGETQERERVLCHFSKRYFQCNPNTLPSEDSVHTLTCALMLLNTDLHGHNIGKRMSCMQFIANLEGLNDGRDFPRDLLKALYNSIKNEKLQWTIDEEELRKSFSELAESRTDSASHTMKRINSGGNPLVGVAQQSNAQLYKNGFLVRKAHADTDGKRTPRGKRGWKSFYAILKGLILYLQKGEYRPDKQLTDEDLKNAVSIHHSLAMRAADYSKRPNVFYLRTADWRVFLFQAPNAEQMQSWITRINTVAAMFSAPPFPAAIGSQKKFSRPLLPGSTTKLSQEEQVQSHESRFRAISSELTELRAVPPDPKVKGREQEEYKQREEYLEFEKTRYGTYAMLLRAKIRSGETDLSAFEARLFDDGGLQRTHSSPTLPQEASSQASQASGNKEVGNSNPAKGNKRGKRSEGQRHSYRQAVKQ
ncbi:PH and SEC7 domain-containing protein 1 isoform X2 [Denticeps clupeoides]|uniref:PH and SEC7 domain-containing protein 1 isoform X2 n=1 Tax=Denticeps clupeoides TaxID=299321 RepID=UPI0010A35EAE|nr:PH and SEC7 domain-containing protein 1-like isoform X2 [Denticeps clupeoides]